MFKTVLLFALVGCGGVASSKSLGVRTTIDMIPKNAPGIVGGYDFELLEPIEGNACADYKDTDTFGAMVPGLDLKAVDLVTRAESAAAYDAITKLQNADTILITRLKTSAEGSAGTKVCATVWGRGVRLTKASATAAVEPPQPQPLVPTKVSPTK